LPKYSLRTHIFQPHNDPILYLIRHGEKPPKQPDGEDGPGLSTLGVDRSQALVKVFGQESPYNIGYIIAQEPKKSMLEPEKAESPESLKVCR